MYKIVRFNNGSYGIYDGKAGGVVSKNSTEVVSKSKDIVDASQMTLDEAIERLKELNLVNDHAQWVVVENPEEQVQAERKRLETKKKEREQAKADLEAQKEKAEEVLKASKTKRTEMIKEEKAIMEATEADAPLPIPGNPVQTR